MSQFPPATLSFEGCPWIAVQSGNATDWLMNRLSLRDPTTLPFWDFWKCQTGEFDAGRMESGYITPPLRGWTCLISHALLPYIAEDARNGEPLTSLCRECSREFGRASGFLSDGHGADYAWIVAQRGRCSVEWSSEETR